MSPDRDTSDQGAFGAFTAKPGLPWDELYKVLRRTERQQRKTPGQNALELLQEAVRRYESPTCLKDVADSCGQSVPQASNSSRELVACGLAKRQSAAVGRSQMVFVEPTKEGFEFLGTSPPAGAGRGGPGHRYCISLVETHLQRKGYCTTREVEIGGKRIDLVAVKGSSKVFVEVEMSEANAARNAAADLAAADGSVKQIAVICPTRKVLMRVQKAATAALAPQALAKFAFKTVQEL